MQVGNNRSGGSSLAAPRGTSPPLQGLLNLAPLLLAALYASRIGAEFITPAIPALGGLIGFGLGAGGMYLLRRHGQLPVWPVFLLLPYVIFPYQETSLALACGLLASAAWLVTHWRWNRWPVDAGIFAAALALFALTLAPGVQPADGGEFQVVIAEWGVAHPPGYALYTVVGGLLARLLPFGDMADRVNLFSAVAGALALAVICRTVRQETRQGWAGVIAAGALGASATFWTTATQASIRPMTALFTALLVEAALAYRRAIRESRERDARLALIRFGLAAGLGVTHHASLIFPGGVLALAVVAARPRLLLRPREWIPALLAALTGVLPWTYLLLRGSAGTLFAPPNLATWSGLWQHVSAAGFAGDMFYYRALPDVIGRLQATGQAVAFQWHGLILILAVFALGVAFWRDRWLALALGGAFGVHVIVAATYRAPQTVEYLIPAYVCLAAGVGWAAGAVHNLKPRGYAGPLLAGLAAVAVAVSGWPTWISLRAYQQIDPTEANARAVLEAAPQDSLILANWHHTTSLWAVQAIDGLRPDVEIHYVAPAGAEPILDTWARLIEEAAEDRPLIACSYYPEVYRHLGRTFSALESCWQVGPANLPAGEVPAASYPEGRITLYRGALPESAAAGEAVSLALFWELPGAVAYGELATFVHLVNGEGLTVAQDDQPMMAEGMEGPGVVAQEYTLHLPRTISPGDYVIHAGVYHPGEGQPLVLPDQDGLLRSPVAPLRVEPPALPPVTARERRIPFGNGSILTGYDYDLSVPGRARLILHWQIDAPPDSPVEVALYDREMSPIPLQAPTLDFPAGETGFLTSAYDLPDTATIGGLWLEIRQGSEVRWARGAWNLPLTAGAWLDGPAPGERYLMLGDVVITRLDIQAAERPGGEASALLTMRSLAPLTADMTFRLALGNAARSDNTPVGGTLPTLKWGWGATITDTLRARWPENTADPGPLTLTLYDAFTSRVWPILDPVLGQSGGDLVLSP